MRALTFFITLLIVSLGALAGEDEFRKLVTYTCDAKTDQLVVKYNGAYDESGEKLIESKGANSWEPGELRGWAPSDPRFASPKTIVRECTLSDGVYVLQVKPVPEDFRNVNGHCGAWETAFIQVFRGGQSLAEIQLDQSCYDESAPVVTKVVIHARQKNATITTTPANEFYK